MEGKEEIKETQAKPEQEEIKESEQKPQEEEKKMIQRVG
mgnify:FL=1|jgi:hypothetical protein